ncbi:hypothetical protein JNJ66_00065 [Candidatus Saccharibacteria bacterium]|nr:hypothetical protein [Candidatus Saccharibacteria bacterium]
MDTEKVTHDSVSTPAVSRSLLAPRQKFGVRTVLEILALLVALGVAGWFLYPMVFPPPPIQREVQLGPAAE